MESNHQLYDVRILETAKALISDPACWYQGGPSSPENPDCMCAVVATSRAFWNLKAPAVLWTSVMGLLDRAVPADFTLTHLYHRPAAIYNDAPTTTHADVMALFDRAIDLAQKRIKTKEQHDAALIRIDELMAAEPNTPEINELNTLASQVMEYESRFEDGQK